MARRKTDPAQPELPLSKVTAASSGKASPEITAPALKHVDGMFENWFIEYASYVILDRAVPHIDDGLKPVQRRIMHSLRELEDGRYNKVANAVGNTMKYHPHGDASITDALVGLGQKELLIDTQGNWGNIITGDPAAAPRYIEARLSKLALDAVFNPKTTEWTKSYDERNDEPVTLPVKFPLLLAQGVEGIAVGLSCKILPHNFNELMDASVAILRGRKVSLLPDFQTGGLADCTDYQDGRRGGKSPDSREDRDPVGSAFGDHGDSIRHGRAEPHRIDRGGASEGEDQDQEGGRQHFGTRRNPDPSSVGQ